MDFSPTQEQKMILESVERFCSREVTPELIKRLDETCHYPVELFKKMGDLGWIGIPFPEQYGGSDGDVTTVFLIVEKLCYAMLAVGNIYYRNVINAGLNILRFGTEEQKRMLLPGLIRGELLFSFGLTEPDAGSDASALRTRAQDRGDHYVLNGTKMFLTGGAYADWIQMFARTGDFDQDHAKKVSAFWVKGDSPGITCTKVEKLGNRPMETYIAHFDDVKVPKNMLIGEIHGAWKQILGFVNHERLAIATECVGAAQRCLDDALAYAKTRVQFGRPISKFQAIQHKLADMQMSVDAARLLIYRGAAMVRDGIDAAKESAMAKIFASETYQKVAIEGMQILGGYGYTNDFSMERHYRDAALYRIAPGTNEILRNLIAHKMGC